MVVFDEPRPVRPQPALQEGDRHFDAAADGPAVAVLDERGGQRLIMGTALAMPALASQLARHGADIKFVMGPGPAAPHVEQSPRPERKPKAPGNALDPILVEMQPTRRDYIAAVPRPVERNFAAISVDIGGRNAAREADHQIACQAAQEAELIVATGLGAAKETIAVE